MAGVFVFNGNVTDESFVLSLYTVRGIVMQMLEQRGYCISDAEKRMSLHEFRVKFNEKR
jgi:hypothetical protein